MIYLREFKLMEQCMNKMRILGEKEYLKVPSRNHRPEKYISEV